ncbi:hypothetical protein QTL95_04635 [Rhizobium sp. S152]|uniref:hypothetical protein n=1 Tax=Rhizobium sp. S152 TaxID=3055038 RepID=UPI0025A9C3CF|nr:hypothetical protein [Rhizobium sp. S152]MDM9625173.1 hypothetical protein [Rhizobium sp. S152]
MDREEDGRGFAAALDNPLPSISPACLPTEFRSGCTAARLVPFIRNRKNSAALFAIHQVIKLILFCSAGELQKLIKSLLSIGCSA